MLKKLLRGIFSIVGLVLGYFIAEMLITIPQVYNLSYFSSEIGKIVFRIIMSFIFGIILYIISPAIYKSISNLIEYIEKNVQKMSIAEIIYGTVGAIIWTYFIYTTKFISSCNRCRNNDKEERRHNSFTCKY